jgi:glycosyltransferase involved in cell wall biosynthesis
MKISVIICTHNPRQDYLTQTLAALRRQTASKKSWELLLIDNASKQLLSKQWDLSWHPHGRIIREKKLGLTQARLRGIREGKGGILVFVDDDNVLHKKYLTNAVEISKKYPKVAVFGGNIKGDYEAGCPSWLKRYEGILAIKTVRKNAFDNNQEKHENTPVGAGLIVKRNLAKKYLVETQKDQLKLNLDRKGTSLTGGGDIDISIAACRHGFQKGVFKKLRLVHLISKKRTSKKYIFNLMRGCFFSKTIRDCHYFRERPSKKDLIKMVLQNSIIILKNIAKGEILEAYMEIGRTFGIVSGFLYMMKK